MRLWPFDVQKTRQNDGRGENLVLNDMSHFRVWTGKSSVHEEFTLENVVIILSPGLAFQDLSAWWTEKTFRACGPAESTPTTTHGTVLFIALGRYCGPIHWYILEGCVWTLPQNGALLDSLSFTCKWARNISSVLFFEKAAPRSTDVCTKFPVLYSPCSHFFGQRNGNYIDWFRVRLQTKWKAPNRSRRFVLNNVPIQNVCYSTDIIIVNTTSLRSDSIRSVGYIYL